MSRTKRSHWMKEEMRDGVKRTHIKRKKEQDVVDAYDWVEGTLYWDDYNTCWTCCSCGSSVGYAEWECERCK